MGVPRKSTKTAKLILRGGHQYVILPKEFEFKGNAVRIYKQGDAVVLEPAVLGVKKWLAEIRRHPYQRISRPGDVTIRLPRSESCSNDTPDGLNLSEGTCKRRQ